MRPFRMRFRRRLWTIRFRDPRSDRIGTCDEDDRIIDIHPKLKGKEMLATLIHEALHASLSDLCEESVDQVSNDLARLVLRTKTKWID